MLEPKSKEKDQHRTRFVLTYNVTLPNAKQVVNKHWHLLKLNSNIGSVFEQEPTIACKQNKNLDDLTGSKKMLDNKVVHKNNGNKQLYCRLCFTRRKTFAVNKV